MSEFTMHYPVFAFDMCFNFGESVVIVLTINRVLQVLSKASRHFHIIISMCLYCTSASRQPYICKVPINMSNTSENAPVLTVDLFFSLDKFLSSRRSPTRALRR